jgi:hypothetical protein
VTDAELAELEARHEQLLRGSGYFRQAFCDDVIPRLFLALREARAENDDLRQRLREYQDGRNCT